MIRTSSPAPGPARPRPRPASSVLHAKIKAYFGEGVEARTTYGDRWKLSSLVALKLVDEGTTSGDRGRPGGGGRTTSRCFSPARANTFPSAPVTGTCPHKDAHHYPPYLPFPQHAKNPSQKKDRGTQIKKSLPEQSGLRLPA